MERVGHILKTCDSHASPKFWISQFYCKPVIKKERENCLQQFELSSLHKPAYKAKIKPTIQKAVDNFRSNVKPRFPDAEII